MKNKIVKCEIVRGGHWEEDTIYTTFEDGTRKKLFGYFSDELFYDTAVTDDVEGYLKDEDVRNLLKQIRDLHEQICEEEPA